MKRGGGSCNVSVKSEGIEEVKVKTFYNHNIYIHVTIPQGCFSRLPSVIQQPKAFVAKTF